MQNENKDALEKLKAENAKEYTIKSMMPQLLQEIGKVTAEERVQLAKIEEERLKLANRQELAKVCTIF